MKRRSFFKNLVGSVAVLVTAYSKPFQRVAATVEPVDSLLIFNPRDYVGSTTWVRLIEPRRWEFVGNTFREVKS